LEEGKDVLFLTIASGISGTFNQAKEAAKALNQHTGLACCYRYFASPLHGVAMS